MAEKEYIERGALQEIFENRMQDDNIMCPVIKVLDVMEIIENQPAADVVEVVRCKDCVHKNPYNRYEFHCKCLRDNLHHNTDDYCSYGKRKDG